MAVGSLLQHNASLWALVGWYAGLDITKLDQVLEPHDKSDWFKRHVVEFPVSEENRNMCVFWSALLEARVNHNYLDLDYHYPNNVHRPETRPLHGQLTALRRMRVGDAHTLQLDHLIKQDWISIFKRNSPPCTAQTTQEIRALLNNKTLQGYLFNEVVQIEYRNHFVPAGANASNMSDPPPSCVVPELCQFCPNLDTVIFSQFLPPTGPIDLTSLKKLKSVVIVGTDLTKTDLIVSKAVKITLTEKLHLPRPYPDRVVKSPGQLLKEQQQKSKACVIL
jgi:hypothetical protein